MELVDENEGYDSEEESGQETTDSQAKSSGNRVINFLGDDDLVPFSMKGFPRQETQAKQYSAQQSAQQSVVAQKDQDKTAGYGRETRMKDIYMSMEGSSLFGKAQSM